ncbi:hypothetical protein DAI22_02g232600 [Oryza sativa Japonica Group]|nr:hypothetical protein DAI22_02g232600 [Oryza sativa Japonica Group]
MPLSFLQSPSSSARGSKSTTTHSWSMTPWEAMLLSTPHLPHLRIDCSPISRAGINVE